jgi:hypothetical protein
MRLSQLAFDHQFERFKNQVREVSGGRPFISFHEGLPAEWEEYKGEVRYEARRILGFREWKRQDIGSGRILENAIQAIELHDHKQDIRNNLVEWQNRYGHDHRSHRALLDARTNSDAQRNFEQWFFDFFHEHISEAKAFESFQTLAGNRYDLIAYIFFLKDWKRFMPIRTTTFDSAFSLLEIDLKTKGRCSWGNYGDYNDALREIAKALRETGGVSDARLIDAHSFCWMLMHLEGAEPIPAPVIPLPRVITTVESDVLVSEPAALYTTYDIVSEEEFIQRDAERRRVGRRAQDVALESEQKRLHEAGHPNPKEVVRPVWNEPARGYDILSCEVDGSPRYIEVKAARQSGLRLSFMLTRSEWQQSHRLPNYYYYLVLNPYWGEPEVLVISGENIKEDCLTPENYRAHIVAT